MAPTSWDDLRLERTGTCIENRRPPRLRPSRIRRLSARFRVAISSPIHILFVYAFDRLSFSRWIMVFYRIRFPGRHCSFMVPYFLISVYLASQGLLWLLFPHDLPYNSATAYAFLTRATTSHITSTCMTRIDFSFCLCSIPFCRIIVYIHTSIPPHRITFYISIQLTPRLIRSSVSTSFWAHHPHSHHLYDRPRCPFNYHSLCQITHALEVALVIPGLCLTHALISSVIRDSSSHQAMISFIHTRISRNAKLPSLHAYWWCAALVG